MFIMFLGGQGRHGTVAFVRHTVIESEARLCTCHCTLLNSPVMRCITIIHRAVAVRSVSVDVCQSCLPAAGLATVLLGLCRRTPSEAKQHGCDICCQQASLILIMFLKGGG